MNIRLMAVAALICGTTTVAAASDDDGVLEVPGEYATIQSAIDNAVDGNEVVVQPGVYAENVDFNGLAITVRSLNPDNSDIVAQTVIDGSGVGSVVSFKSGEDWSAVLEGFTITNGSGTASPSDWTVGGGLYLVSSSPTIRHCVISNNMADGGGGMYCSGPGPRVSNCVFRENTSTGWDNNGSGGGGAILSNGSSIRVANCSFIDNTAIGSDQYSPGRGGAVRATGGSPMYANCLFVNNQADIGGVAEIRSGTASLTNCTIVGNAAAQYAGVFHGIWSSATIAVENSILWDNTAGNGILFRSLGGASIEVTQSNVQPDADGDWGGVENMSLDPDFVNPSAGDFRLAAGSPCIDEGNDSSLPSDFGDVDNDDDMFETVPLDCALTVRTQGAHVDLGAFERLDCPSDLTGDGLVNVFDLLDLLANWGGGGAGADIASPNDVVNVFDLLDMLASWGLCD